jgi:hypothetical protein
MRKVIILIFMNFVIENSFCQKVNFKNELAFSPIKVSTFPFHNWIYDQPNIVKLGLTAIYKREIYPNLHARLSQSYFKYDYSNPYYRHTYNRIIKEISTSIGMQFTYYQSKNKKFKFYSGMDLTGFFNTVTSVNLVFQQTVTQKGIGIQPCLGLVMLPIEKLSITVESSFLGAISKMNPSSSMPEVQSFAQVYPLRWLSFGWKF